MEFSFYLPNIDETVKSIRRRINLILGHNNHYDSFTKYPKVISKEENVDTTQKVNQIVYMLDKNGNIIYANEKTLVEFNSNLDDFLGESIFDLYRMLGNHDMSWYDTLKTKYQANNLVKIENKGKAKWFFVNYRSNFDSKGEIESIIAKGNDVTFLAEADVIKDFYSDKDLLTGLVNQYGMIEKMKNFKDVKTGIAFCVEALNFSQVTNYYGHEIGDKVLNAIVDNINSMFSENSLVVRYTDQKFVILCTNCGIDQNDIDLYLKKMSKFTSTSYQIDDLNLQVDKRIGYAVFPQDTDNFEELITLSSIALKEAIAKNSYDMTRFNKVMKDNLKYNVEIANRLKDALDNELIEVFFQKAINCSNDKIFVIEELSRWNDADLGYIPPMEYFRVAKETNQLNRLERYMVKKTLDNFSIIRQKEEFKDAKVTINISPATLLDYNFFEFFDQMVSESEISPKDIFIEISESTFVNNIETCLERINKYKSKGYLIALDDFGTEYSSLSILESVDFDIIKIDAHFVRNIEKFSNQEIIKMVRKIASQTQKEIVAEGVETSEQRDALIKLGCYIQQGYFHHRPENLISY